MDIARLVLRREELLPAPENETSGCDSGNEYDGRLGVRISAIFVILVGSTIGQSFHHHQGHHQIC